MDVNKYFPVLSHYNAIANKTMYGILADLPEARLTEEVGSYFKSIYGIINHIYGADVLWLQRIKKTISGPAALHSTELDIEIAMPSAAVFKSFAELRRRREALDAVIVELTEELSEADLDAVIDYTNSRGQRNRFILWQAVMHMFNHETHHRGMVAEILDQLGVTNDYSNIISTLTQPPAT